MARPKTSDVVEETDSADDPTPQAPMLTTPVVDMSDGSAGIDPMVMMQQMMAQIAKLTSAVTTLTDQNAALSAQVQAVQNQSQQTALKDEYGLEVNALPDGAIQIGSARMASIEEKVNILEKQAEREGMEFDRDRVTKIYVWMALPPAQRRRMKLEDLHPYICKHCGTGFREEESEDYEIHVSEHLQRARELTGLRVG